MKKISYLHIFCRQGRILIANSDELNKLISDKGDKFMIIPILFDTDHVQIREVDAEEIKNLLPNAIITSPYEPNLDNKKKPKYSLNSIAFSAKKLIDDATELARSFSISKLF